MRPEDMMVLCPNHHDRATRDAFTEAKQRYMKAHPHNGGTSGVLGDIAVPMCPEVQLGNLAVVNSGTILMFGNRPVIALERHPEEGLLLSLDVRGPTGRQLLYLRRNEWVASEGLWDVEAKYKKLKIWETEQDVSLEIDASKSAIRILRGSLWDNGRQFKIKPNGVWIGGERPKVGFSNFSMDGLSLALHAVDEKGRTTFSFAPAGGIPWVEPEEFEISTG
jgi:hypothetical protein